MGQAEQFLENLECFKDDGAQCFLVEQHTGIEKALAAKSYYSDTDHPDNYTFHDAWNHRQHSSEWRNAVSDELESMKKNDVWVVTERPPGVKPIGSRWVFKHKLRKDGSIARHKARLVAKGYTQKHGIDFNETFAPVARLGTLRCLFTLAGLNDWNIHQLDAKTAFLCAEIDEPDVYITPPPGLALGSKFADPVLHLKKGIYGLRQSPRLWYGRLTDYLKTIGFSMSNYDNCIWINESTGVLIAIYVDDILVTGPSEDKIDFVKTQLKEEFEMTDSNEVDFFLGIQVRRGGGKGGYAWSQEHYIEKLLEQWEMRNCEPVKTPMDKTYLAKRKPDENPADKHNYQSAVGSLMYLMMASRPDIAFAVSHLSKFCSDPSEKHWLAVKRLLRYLRGTSKLALLLGVKGRNSGVVGYTDADWASDSEDRKSVGAYLFFVCGSVVSWTAKKQAFVATSTMESEYVAAAQAAKEAIWLREFFGELTSKNPHLKVPGFTHEKPIEIFCDNQAAIRVAKNAEHHKKAKHIDISYQFLRQRVHLGHIRMTHISTKDMVADALTKPLTYDKFINCRDAMNLEFFD